MSPTSYQTAPPRIRLADYREGIGPRQVCRRALGGPQNHSRTRPWGVPYGGPDRHTQTGSACSRRGDPCGRPSSPNARLGFSNPGGDKPRPSHETNAKGSLATVAVVSWAGRCGWAGGAPGAQRQRSAGTALGRFHGTSAEGSPAPFGGRSMIDGVAGPEANPAHSEAKRRVRLWGATGSRWGISWGRDRPERYPRSS